MRNLTSAFLTRVFDDNICQASDEVPLVRALPFAADCRPWSRIVPNSVSEVAGVTRPHHHHRHSCSFGYRRYLRCDRRLDHSTMVRLKYSRIAP